MIVHGHRGARFEAPENTLTGFAHAASIGLSAVEFDVRMSADGEGDVAELSLSQLQALDARSDHVDWSEPARIPTLPEVLDATAGFDRLEIEIKRDSAGRDAEVVQRLVEQLDADVSLVDRAVLTSFHPDLLLLVRDLRPDLALGLIGRFDHVGWLALVDRLDVSRVDVQQPYASGEVVAALGERRSVLGWPCNDASDLAALRAVGVTEAVTSDAPTEVLRLLAG